MFIESSRMSVLFLILRLPKRRKFVSHTMSQIFSWMLLPSIFKILLMESNQKFNFLISRISEKSVTCKMLKHYIYQINYIQTTNVTPVTVTFLHSIQNEPRSCNFKVWHSANFWKCQVFILCLDVVFLIFLFLIFAIDPF